jgi:hypothetical protein
MAKFLLALHGGGLNATPAEQEASLAAWGAWYGALGAAIVDPGNPVGHAVTVASDGSTSDGGGPNPVTGYLVIDAADLNAAGDLSKGCPILAAGGSVEICETIDVM